MRNRNPARNQPIAILDKIAWFATKRVAKRSARLYHLPAAAPRAEHNGNLDM
jgi:hypothetical protein